MAKANADDIRVEEGVNEYAGKWYGYAKRDVRDDPEDLYEYRYEETGPHSSEEAAREAAEKLLGTIKREQRNLKVTKNAAYEEGGAGLRLQALREEAATDKERLLDTGEIS